MKYYVIEYENGLYQPAGYFDSYQSALDFAENLPDYYVDDFEFTISEYDSEEEFLKVYEEYI